MRFFHPPDLHKPTLQQKFDQHFELFEQRRRVRAIIKAEVKAYQAERLGPRLRGLEAQRREAEREHALAQAGGDADAVEYHQAKINRAAGEISEIRGAIGE